MSNHGLRLVERSEAILAVEINGGNLEYLKDILKEREEEYRLFFNGGDFIRIELPNTLGHTGDWLAQEQDKISVYSPEYFEDTFNVLASGFHKDEEEEA